MGGVGCGSSRPVDAVRFLDASSKCHLEARFLAHAEINLRVPGALVELHDGQRHRGGIGQLYKERAKSIGQSIKVTIRRGRAFK